MTKDATNASIAHPQHLLLPVKDDWWNSKLISSIDQHTFHLCSATDTLHSHQHYQLFFFTTAFHIALTHASKWYSSLQI